MACYFVGTRLTVLLDVHECKKDALLGNRHTAHAALLDVSSVSDLTFLATISQLSPYKIAAAASPFPAPPFLAPPSGVACSGEAGVDDDRAGRLFSGGGLGVLHSFSRMCPPLPVGARASFRERKEEGVREAIGEAPMCPPLTGLSTRPHHSRDWRPRFEAYRGLG